MTSVCCPICQHKKVKEYLKARDYISGEIFHVKRCCNCGIAFTQPWPVKIDYYYPSYYRRYSPIALTALRFLYNLRVRSWVRALGRSGTVLELGCSNGWMLNAFRQQGWQVIGIERTPAALSFTKSKLNLPVFVGSLDALHPNSYFDLIIMFQVLEHLPDPLATLHKCAQLIRPGGILIIGVPNLDSWQSRFSGPHWLHLDVPRHLFHFSPQSISYALMLTGFDVSHLSFASFEHDPYGWLQSILNRLGFKQNMLTKFLMGIKHQDATSNSGIVMGVLSLFLLIPSLWLALFSWLAGAGALLEVRAIRREM